MTHGMEVIDLTLLSDDEEQSGVQQSLAHPHSGQPLWSHYRSITGRDPLSFVPAQPARPPTQQPEDPIEQGPSAAEIYRSVLSAHPSRQSRNAAPQTKSVSRPRTSGDRSGPIIVDSEDEAHESPIVIYDTDEEAASASSRMSLSDMPTTVEKAGSDSDDLSLSLDVDAESALRSYYSRHCEPCDVSLPSEDAYAQHLTSVPHLLAKAVVETPSSTPAQPSNYGVSASSVGFKLLQMAGWQPGTGLGAESQGRLQPVSVTYKNDKRGLGLATKSKHQLSYTAEDIHSRQQQRKNQPTLSQLQKDARKAERERQELMAYLKK
ncbi:hypothetical protein DFJ77DRAFT_308716 [Powellomyces hirtus]|nr:hypothetical protein DFJ77DRAFT_308716 [Powellomyces hirtus]